MKEWHPEKKKRFRGAVLTMLSGRHGAQLSRMDDVSLTHAMQSLAWDIGINDVVTILQEMEQRDWVKFDSLQNRFTGRRELSKIEICPDGQDLVDQTIKHPAVTF